METAEHQVFRCGDCDKQFTSGKKFKRHRDQHIKPHICSLCKKGFSLKTGLERHRQIHRPRKSRETFKCNVPGCSFVETTRRDYLRIHLKKKHNVLPEFYDGFTIETATFQDELDLRLLEAAHEGDTEKVRRLLSEGADISTVNKDGQTPDELAARGGHRDVLILLYTHGVDVDLALHKAIRDNRPEAVETVINSGAHINQPTSLHGTYPRETPLSGAVRYRNRDMARLLLRLGADVNATSEWHETALHFAAARNYPDMIKLLLEANADVNLKNEWGNSPLCYTVGLSPYRSFYQNATKLLLEAGVTVEQRYWDVMPRWFRDKNARYDPTLQHSTLGL